MPTGGADAGAKPLVSARQLREPVGTWKFIGADKVIDYTKEDFNRSGIMYDIIFDAVKTISVSRSIKALNKNGTMILRAAGISEMLQGLWISMTSNKRVMTGVISHTAADIIFIKELVEKDKFKPIVDRTYPLEQITEVHAYVEKGHKKGNVVITMSQNRDYCIID